MPLDQAQLTLASAGFQVNPTPQFEISDQIAENSVIRTDPAGRRAGGDHDRDHARRVVGTGPGGDAGASSSASRSTTARAFLEAEPYGFRVTVTEEETDQVNAGLVIRTNPQAGTLVDKGGQVTLVVSTGAPSAEVPNVVGQTRAEAEAALAQFDVDVSFQDLPPGDGNDGRVTAQSVDRRPAGADRLVDHDHRRAGAAAPTTHHDAAPTTTTTDAPPAAADDRGRRRTLTRLAGSLGIVRR